jgi:hypothetical protein
VESVFTALLGAQACYRQFAPDAIGGTWNIDEKSHA